MWALWMVLGALAGMMFTVLVSPFYPWVHELRDPKRRAEITWQRDINRRVAQMVGLGIEPDTAVHLVMIEKRKESDEIALALREVE